ncbi:MAG: hypothetical protein ACYC36_02555 [Bellilinea sp.]
MKAELDIAWAEFCAAVRETGVEHIMPTDWTVQDISTWGTRMKVEVVWEEKVRRALGRTTSIEWGVDTCLVAGIMEFIYEGRT